MLAAKAKNAGGSAQIPRYFRSPHRSLVEGEAALERRGLLEGLGVAGPCWQTTSLLWGRPLNSPRPPQQA
jgi:hypothetical protein